MFLHAVGRWVVARGWLIGLAVAFVTVLLGTAAFLDVRPDGKTPSVSDALYKAVGLLAIQNAADPTADWRLDVARWLGLLFWASAVFAIVVRVFRQPVLRWVVRTFARKHVILAGLGDDGAKLVDALRAEGKTVVVIDPDLTRPQAERCRAAGAVVLAGSPDDPRALQAANLSRAEAVLALFRDEASGVRTATAAASILPAGPTVRCVVRLTEPGQLDVVRRHRMKTDPAARPRLEILNPHEIAAAALVREAVALGPDHGVRKLLVLGLGAHHRLGELVVLRAAKDWLIEHDGRPPTKLAIHVFDRDAAGWTDTLHARFPHLAGGCEIVARSGWARKAGGGQFDPYFDAAIVCIDDEPHAIAQGVMLRREVMLTDRPVLVAVRHSRSGYGQLLRTPDSGWGTPLVPVGVDDPLFDPAAATRPELELRARTIHQHYRRGVRGKPDPANVPWADLPETFRRANRALAERYAVHLAFTNGEKTTAYRAEYTPDRFDGRPDALPLVFRFSPAEAEAVAAHEHDLWRAERQAEGWRYGEVKDAVRKTNPLLVDYDRLTDEQRSHNRQFVRDLPRVFALADYAVVPAGVPAADEA